MGRLEGKVAIVTGGASGIGRASALRLAREGAKVLVADVNDTAGAETAAQIRAAGGEAAYLHTDVSQSAQVQAMIAEAERRWGGLDILFNNAGIAVFKGFEDTTEAEWERVIGVNLTGVFLGIKYGAALMKRQGRGGSIINTASVHGQRTVAGVTAYSAAKHGVIGLTQSAAYEFGPYNIRVNAILPGAIDTPLMRANLRAVGDEAEGYRAVAAAHALKRVGDPDEIAKGVVFLASDEASFITGAQFEIDGGLLARLM